MWQLILFRGIQGLGAGALFPIALAVIGDLFTPGRARQVPGPVRRRLRHRRRSSDRPSAASSPTPSAGTGSSSSTSRSGSSSLFVIWRLLPTVKRPGATPQPRLSSAPPSSRPASRRSSSASPTSRSGDWTRSPTVGGLIGPRPGRSAVLVVFLFVESRAKEPIVPLDLFRNRTYAVVDRRHLPRSASASSAAIIFLPRWFQVVRAMSATESGYQIAAAAGRA